MLTWVSAGLGTLTETGGRPDNRPGSLEPGERTIPDEARIIERILDGDVNSFELLLQAHSRVVANIVRRHVPEDQVEDVSQEVFIRAYKSLASLRNPHGFRPWVASIAAKTCCDFWRKRYKTREVTMTALVGEHHDWLDRVSAEQSTDSYESLCARKEAREVLDHALEQLSPKDRMVIELVYLEGLTGKEAAKALNWTTANVKVRCYRARKKLEKVLQDMQNR
ncbi:MAG: RNA polymerase sigma factor [Desulfatibacillum sp.]|nr:RNA polymerase sigma factor [Desulfatibacillum sp.]